jgi:hypothetical protein
MASKAKRNMKQLAVSRMTYLHISKVVSAEGKITGGNGTARRVDTSKTV